MGGGAIIINKKLLSIFVVVLFSLGSEHVALGNQLPTQHPPWLSAETKADWRTEEQVWCDRTTKRRITITNDTPAEVATISDFIFRRIRQEEITYLDKVFNIFILFCEYICQI